MFQLIVAVVVLIIGLIIRANLKEKGKKTTSALVTVGAVAISAVLIILSWIQKNTVEMPCFSSDIQEVNLVYTINYQIKKSDAQTIYRTIGESYYQTVIQPCITESVKVVTARYTAEELVGRRDELAAAIESDLTQKLLAYNIEVISTSIENLDFTDAFTDAVEAKQVAQQNKLRAQTEAEQKIVEANAAAEVKKVNADAAAYELLAEAKAKAEANKELSASLTEKLIQYTYAQNWNGELPTVMTGENGSLLPVLDVNQMIPETTAEPAE